MKANIFTILFLITAFLLTAQDAKKVWTLREAIDHAISNNLTVKRNTYGVQTGEINYLQSKMAMLPSLNGSGSFGYNWGRSIDPFTNLFTEQRVNSINMNASSSMLLWNGFRLFYAMKQNEADLDAANEDLMRARNDVIINVITLYLNIVFNKELYSNAELQLQSTQEQLIRTRKLAEAGSVPRADVLQLESQAASNELSLVQRENAVNLSFLQLKQALQLPGSTAMDVELPQVNIDNNLLIEKGPDEIFEIATMSMPEIRVAEARRKSSELAFRSSKGNLYPRLTFNASISTIYSDQRKQFFPDGGSTITTRQIGYVDGTSTPVFADQVSPTGELLLPTHADQFKNNQSKGIGLNLQIPIFNGFSARSTVQRSAINRNLAEISFYETTNLLRQAVENAYNDALAASKTYAAAQRQVQALDESNRMNKQRFDLGAINFVEYQISQNNFFSAQSDLLRAKYDFLFRKKILDFYQGLPLDF